MNRSSLTVGVLGGMGPDATVDFMNKVISLTPADSEQDHIRLLVDQNPCVPSRQAAILGDGEDPGPLLAAMASGLEAGGADFLVMPCNTAHAFQTNIENAVGIPFISIVDAAIDAAAGANCIGLLATAGCLDANVYQPGLERRGMNFVVPDSRAALAINELVFGIKIGDRSDATAAAARGFALSLIEQGADAIIAACTELPLVIRNGDIDVPLFASTDELAKKTVALAKGLEPLPMQ